MIAARRQEGFVAGFGAYVQWLLRRSFRGLWLSQGAAFPPSGFVAVANHTSWWDGFVAFAVQRALAPRRPFFVMMSEEGLRRFPFFRYGGAFAVDASSPRRARDAILYAADRAGEGAGLWIFPQGRLEAPGMPLVFARGFEYVARRAGVPVVPCAMRFALLDGQRPDAFFDIGPTVYDASRARAELARGAVAAMLGRLDRSISSGRAFEDRRSLMAPARGIDDVSGRMFAPFGKRL